MAPSFFEGPEKKVELVVSGEFGGLRQLGDAFWKQVVRAARAEVLSKISSDAFDAYLLSESSLFVYDDHMTMITCGRTTLIDAVVMVIERVSPENVALLVYERKNEHFPREQPSSFYDDAKRLSKLVAGRALRFGSEHDHRIFVFHSVAPYSPDSDDTTIEILMHGIADERAQRFHFGEKPPEALAAAAGLDLLLPGFEIDEHAFSPAGYSLNAVKGGEYYTIHVTPEEIGSYVSFETNHDFRRDPTELISRVVGWFRPESFDVLTFRPDAAEVLVALPDYQLRKHVRERVNGYDVSFLHYFQPCAGPTRAFAIELEP